MRDVIAAVTEERQQVDGGCHFAGLHERVVGKVSFSFQPEVFQGEGGLGEVTDEADVRDAKSNSAFSILLPSVLTSSAILPRNMNGSAMRSTMITATTMAAIFDFLHIACYVMDYSFTNLRENPHPCIH